MKQKKKQPELEIPALDSGLANARKNSFLLAIIILAPYIVQWGWLGLRNDIPTLFLPAACGWLFLVTWFIIRLDDQMALAVYRDFPHGRLVNLSTVSVWVGFIIIPVIGLLLLPERPVYMMVTVYLVMGLTNLLFKLDRRKAFRNWLEACKVSPGEVRTIHDIYMMMWDTGLYALAVRPWWVMRIAPKGNGCVVQLMESEGQTLGELSPGKRRHKYLAGMFFAVEWVEKQLHRLEQKAT